MPIVTTTTSTGQGLTFLQLVQRLRQECGVSGSAPATLQGTLTAEIARLANWINAAWMDIQNARRDWYFMREDITFVATNDLGRTYTPTQAGVSLVSGYKLDSFRCYPEADGIGAQQYLPWRHYDTFRNQWMFGAQSLVASRPIEFSVDPHKNLLLGPIPDQNYVVTGEAYLQPTNLVADADFPTMPPQFHMLVVYKAMQYYAGYENAPEVYDTGDLNYRRMMTQLVLDQAPQIELDGALA